jgi:16S rRNA (guanine527-N7)-methyltransferase
MARLKGRAASLTCSVEQIAKVLGQVSEPGAELVERLQIWSELLDKWSTSQRLVGWRRAEGLLSEGLLDAWAAVPLLRDSAPRPIIDLGSGSGLPAVVFAAAFPSREMHLVEARRKRASFLQASARALGLEQVLVHNARLEDLLKAGILPRGALVTARAFAPPAAVLVAAHKLAASYVLLSISTDTASEQWPTPWSEIERRCGAPEERRIHVLLKA